MPLQSLPGSMCSSTAASGPLLHKRTISSSSSSFIIFFFTASCGGFVSTSVFVIRRDFRPRQTRILGKDTTIEVLLLSSSFFFHPLLPPNLSILIAEAKVGLFGRDETKGRNRGALSRKAAETSHDVHWQAHTSQENWTYPPRAGSAWRV